LSMLSTAFQAASNIPKASQLRADSRCAVQNAGFIDGRNPRRVVLDMTFSSLFARGQIRAPSGTGSGRHCGRFEANSDQSWRRSAPAAWVGMIEP
jgi:hypothetical protein